MSKSPTISIVIPAYNEQEHLRACLEAVSTQTEAPFEVIVVDNSSSDDTAEIARSYPFVRVISEPQRGIVFARNTGFDAARGDIIARLDADVVPALDWVCRVRQSFANPDIAGVTGLAVTNSLPRISAGRSRFWMRIYLLASERYFGARMLCGANMAMRRAVWGALRAETCADPLLVHEDQDVALVLAGHGYRVKLDSRLLVAFDGNDFHDWVKFKRYMQQRWRTKRYHAEHRTLDNPVARRLSLMRRCWLFITTVAPTLAFVTSCFCGGLPGMLRRFTAQASVAWYRLSAFGRYPRSQ